MLLFVDEGQYATYFQASSDKIVECRRGSIIDFNEQPLAGVVLKPNPIIDIQLDLRSLFDEGLDPAERIITLKMDNSVNAFRRIVLRRTIGAGKDYFTMTPETEVRATQADNTFRWLVKGQNGKDRLQDICSLNISD